MHAGLEQNVQGVSRRKVTPRLDQYLVGEHLNFLRGGPGNSLGRPARILMRFVCRRPDPIHRAGSRPDRAPVTAEPQLGPTVGPVTHSGQPFHQLRFSPVVDANHGRLTGSSLNMNVALRPHRQTTSADQTGGHTDRPDRSTGESDHFSGRVFHYPQVEGRLHPVTARRRDRRHPTTLRRPRRTTAKVELGVELSNSARVEYSFWKFRRDILPRAEATAGYEAGDLLPERVPRAGRTAVLHAGARTTSGTLAPSPASGSGGANAPARQQTPAAMP